MKTTGPEILTKLKSPGVDAMWPFKRKHQSRELRPWPQRASEADQIRMAAHAADINIIVDEHSVTTMTGTGGVIPGIMLSLPPGETIDFADPVTGFGAANESPPPERVLRLWGDDLLTISHGDRWQFIVDAADPFPRGWIELLFPSAPGGSDASLRLAYVAIRFGEITARRAVPMTELDTEPLALVHIEDRRSATPHSDS